MKLNLGEIKAKNVTESEVVYDDSRHISFTLKYVDRKKLNDLNKQFTKTKFNPKTHQKEESVDYEALRDEICRTCVIGWKGVTLGWLQTQMPIDPEVVKKNGIDAEIDFDEENLKELVSSGNGIDTWILEQVRDPENFKGIVAQKEQVKN